MYTITPAGTYLSQIRADLDLLVGTSLGYGGGLEGGYTSAHAELAYRVDQGMGLAVSGLLVDEADGPLVIARAIRAGLNPRPGTRSRYVVQIAGDGTLPQGALLQGGGPSGRSQWSVADATTVVSDGDDVTIEAVSAGVITFAGLTDLSIVTPITGITGATYDPGEGDPFQVGREPESIPQLRARLARPRPSPGSLPGLRTAVLDIDWVVAVDVTIGPGDGEITVTVAPAPVGTDQEVELGETIRDHLGIAVPVGTESVDVDSINPGQTTAIGYSTGSTQTVDVAFELLSDGTRTDDDLKAGAEATIEGVFAALGFGDILYVQSAIAEVVELAGVVGVQSLTWDGGSVSVAIVPDNAADSLALGTLTMVVVPVGSP